MDGSEMAADRKSKLNDSLGNEKTKAERELI